MRHSPISGAGAWGDSFPLYWNRKSPLCLLGDVSLECAQEVPRKGGERYVTPIIRLVIYRSVHNVINEICILWGAGHVTSEWKYELALMSHKHKISHWPSRIRQGMSLQMREIRMLLLSLPLLSSFCDILRLFLFPVSSTYIFRLLLLSFSLQSFSATSSFYFFLCFPLVSPFLYNGIEFWPISYKVLLNPF